MTSKRRAGSLRAAAAPARPPVAQQADDVVQETIAAPVAPTPRRRTENATESRKIKYSALLDEDTSDAFDDLVRVAKRQLHQHVDKAGVLRALVLLAADDASLRDQMIAEIGKKGSAR